MIEIESYEEKIPGRFALVVDSQPNVYKVITKDASKAGDVALGYFYCQHIKQEKVLEEHFQLSVPQTDQSLLVDAGENKFCFAVI